jgi:hypothetical protein
LEVDDGWGCLLDFWLGNGSTVDAGTEVFARGGDDDCSSGAVVVDSFEEMGEVVIEPFCYFVFLLDCLRVESLRLGKGQFDHSV